MDDADGPKNTVLAKCNEDEMVLDTTVGRLHLRWDETAQATPHVQNAFCAAQVRHLLRVSP